MGRLRDFVVLVCVALAVAGSRYVLGQVQKAAAPPPPAPPQMKITVKAQPAAKKANAPALGIMKIQAEMRKLDVIGNLRQLGDDLKKENGLSIAQCEYWSDTLDRWADDLIDPVSGGT